MLSRHLRSCCAHGMLNRSLYRCRLLRRCLLPCRDRRDHIDRAVLRRIAGPHFNLIMRFTLPSTPRLCNRRLNRRCLIRLTRGYNICICTTARLQDPQRRYCCSRRHQRHQRRRGGFWLPPCSAQRAALERMVRGMRPQRAMQALPSPPLLPAPQLLGLREPSLPRPLQPHSQQLLAQRALLSRRPQRPHSPRSFGR